MKLRLILHKRKEIENQLAEMNQQLIISARQAGMAEIATAVLHNIGNVLNSINVSVGIAHENIVSSKLDKLETVSKWFRKIYPI